jgi:carboxyl-terminal processing protease
MPESKNDFDAETEEQCGGRPLAVLVDRGSASAAEIVAGALQDWERAVLVGETTFGKGSVQTISQLGPEFGVKITTAYWYTPSGRCINRKRDKDSSVVSDTIEKPGPEYRTLGSLRRSLYGGGGIAPDLVVPYEKLSGLAVRITRDAYFDYAVSYVNAHPGTTPSFSAGDAVLTDFSQFLATTKELSFRPAEFDSSREYIAEQIEVEVAGKLRGVRGEYQVRLRHDPQVRRAVELLNAASSTGQILRGLD